MDKMPMSFEPFRPNSWMLSFPDDFDLPEYVVNKVSRLKHYGDGGWKKITITLLDVIGVEATRKLVANFNHAPLKVTLKKLDPTGVCVETIDISSKTFDVDFGTFDYSKDNISRIKVILQPNKIWVNGRPE